MYYAHVMQNIKDFNFGRNIECLKKDLTLHPVVFCSVSSRWSASFPASPDRTVLQCVWCEEVWPVLAGIESFSDIYSSKNRSCTPAGSLAEKRSLRWMGTLTDRDINRFNTHFSPLYTHVIYRNKHLQVQKYWSPKDQNWNYLLKGVCTICIFFKTKIICRLI